MRQRSGRSPCLWWGSESQTQWTSGIKQTLISEEHPGAWKHPERDSVRLAGHVDFLLGATSKRGTLEIIVCSTAKLACALLLTFPCQWFTLEQHPFFLQSRAHSPLHPEPAAQHCPFKALVGQHQGLSHQHCPATVGTPSHGHFPGPLLFVEEFQCFADSKKIKQREDGVFPSLRTKDLVLYLRIFVFCDVSEKYTPVFSVIVCLFPTVMGLSPHVLLCSLETSNNKENRLWYIVVEQNQTVLQWDLFLESKLW